MRHTLSACLFVRPSRLSALPVVLLYVGLACLASPSAAFRIQGADGDSPPHIYPQNAAGEHRFRHWDLRPLPECQLPWSRGAGTADIGGDAEWIDVVAALETWNDVSPSLIEAVEVAAPAGALPAFQRDKNNIIEWGAGLGAATLAATATWTEVSTGRILEADILINDDHFTWTRVGHNVPMGGNPDVRTVVTHEVGHLLGLGHADGNGDSNPPGPIMNGELDVGGNSNHLLSDDDRDGANFLYNQDLGDAPDPCRLGGVVGLYPSLVHGDAPGDTLNGFILDSVGAGASHIFGIRTRQPLRNYLYEWLGGATPDTSSNADSECEADIVDRDEFDDGISFFPNPPMWGRPLTVTATINVANDATGAGHDYDSGRPLFWNVWFDRNQNCSWEEVGLEHVVHDSLTPPDTTLANLVRTFEESRLILLPNFLIEPLEKTWLRTRIDWGEDAGVRDDIDGTLQFTEGAAQFGEVEDYPLKCGESKYYNMQICLPDGHAPYRGSVAVTTSDMTGGGFFFADVDADDCVLNAFSTVGLETTYDHATDETTIVFEEPGTLHPKYRHIGWCPEEIFGSEGAPPTMLRSYLLPEEGEPTEEEWVPTVHCERFGYDGYDHLMIGTADAGSGGFIGGRQTGGSWNDTLSVVVSYWIPDDVVPLPNLSPCDPLIETLDKVYVGEGTVTPESPFVFRIDHGPEYQEDELVILEVETRWSTNGIVNRQLVEFLGTDSPGNVTEETEVRVPSLRMHAAPNPATSGTALHFELPRSGKVSLEIFDAQGARVRFLLDDESLLAGAHRRWWDGTNETGRPAPSGVYFGRLRSEAGSTTGRIILRR